MEEVDQILDSANMVAIAENLLERYSSSELDKFLKEALKNTVIPMMRE